ACRSRRTIRGSLRRTERGWLPEGRCSWALFSADPRQPDGGENAARRIGLEPERRPLAVLRTEPRPYVGQPDAGSGSRGESLPGIGDREHEGFAFAGGGEADRAAFGERPDAVLDRVLDQGREHHRRNASLEQRRRHVDRALQPRAHADLLHAQESANELDLVGERSVVVAHPRQRRAQVPGELREHGAPRAGVALAEAPYIGEGIEQEMRLDLRLQEAQPRLELLLLERRT